MGEITLFSLLLGSIGAQAVVVGGWLRWQQLAVQRQCEEEESLTPYETKDAIKASIPEARALSSGSQASGSQPQLKIGAGASWSAAPAGATTVPKDPRLVGWEFKIVRSSRDVFRDPKVLQRMCDEESLSGWILLEKLDDRRVRFKRPTAFREIIQPDMVPVDPYRTHYGPSGNLTTSMMTIGSLLFMVLPAYLGYMLVSSTFTRPAPTADIPHRMAPIVAPVEPPKPEPAPSHSSEPSSNNSSVDPSVVKPPALMIPDSMQPAQSPQ